MSRNETEQWKLSRQWMIEQGVIPPIHPATKPTADLVDFARCLRDGVYLCVTLNKIKPNCVQFSPRPTMQVTYVRNINAFLTCCYEVFRIQEEYLFEEADLYDVTNFQKVIQTLSRLSWTQQALSHGWEPFPRESEKDIYDQEQESIYANLEDLAFESAQTIEDNSTIYDVVPTEEDEDIYGDESIYAAVVAYQSLPQVIPKSQNEKRHNICMELLETEKSYISVLLLIVEVGVARGRGIGQARGRGIGQASGRGIGQGRGRGIGQARGRGIGQGRGRGIGQGRGRGGGASGRPGGGASGRPGGGASGRPGGGASGRPGGGAGVRSDACPPPPPPPPVQTYQAVLKSHLSEEDQILLFMLPGKLLPCHHVLVEGVQQAVDNPQVDLATFFLDQQQGLLQYGIYVATLPTATKKAKQLQESREVGKLLQETMAKSPQRFPLSDLLTIPLQRITKYPLLIKELLKCAEKQVPRNAQEITNLQALLDKMQDIVQYVNEAKRDFEHLKLVMEIEQSINDSKVGVTNLGRFRNDGELKVKSDDEKEAKKKWFFLFDKGLLICNMQKKVWGMGPIRYYMKDVIDTHSIVISDLPNQQQGKKLVYPFKLSATSGSCATGPQSIVCYALAADIKTQWVQSFESAKNIARPALYNHGHHEFELETFSKPTMCSGCKKLLCGSYFQGYMCRHCSVSCHLDCMKTIRKCRAATGEDLNSSHGSTRSSEVRPKSKISVDATLHLSKGEGVPRPGSIFFALEKYDHPLFVSATNNRRALMLAKGEEVEIADANDPNWWEVSAAATHFVVVVPLSACATLCPVVSCHLCLWVLSLAS
nr:guanine nucleotide exchange factor VAV [Halisarca dujardinii]